MNRLKLARRGCLGIALLILAVLLAYVFFVSRRSAAQSRFEREHQAAVDRVRKMAAAASEPADDDGSTTPTTPGATPLPEDEVTGPEELAGQLEQLREKELSIIGMPEVIDTPRGDEVGFAYLCLPLDPEYFTPDPAGHLKPTEKTMRKIREKVAYKRGALYDHHLVKPPRIEAPATTPTAESESERTIARRAGSSPARAPQPLIKPGTGNRERLAETLDLAGRMLGQPRVQFPQPGEPNQFYPITDLQRLAPATLARAALAEGAPAATRRFERFLRLMHGYRLYAFPDGEPDWILLLRSLALLDATDGLDPTALPRLERQLAAMRLTHAQLADLCQAHAALIRKKYGPGHDPTAPASPGDATLRIKMGIERVGISFLHARLQPAVQAWARGDEAAYDAFFSEPPSNDDSTFASYLINQYRRMNSGFGMFQVRFCPPELAPWATDARFNETVDLTRCLLAAIRYRREHSREPARLEDIVPAYLDEKVFAPAPDSAWLVDQPGITSVPLILDWSQGTTDAFTQAVSRCAAKTGLTPRASEALRSHARNDEEFRSFADRFQAVEDRPLYCHFTHGQVSRRRQRHTGEGSPIPDGRDSADYVQVRAIWTEPALIDHAWLEQLNNLAK